MQCDHKTSRARISLTAFRLLNSAMLRLSNEAISQNPEYDLKFKTPKTKEAYRRCAITALKTSSRVMAVVARASK